MQLPVALGEGSPQSFGRCWTVTNVRASHNLGATDSLLADPCHLWVWHEGPQKLARFQGWEQSYGLPTYMRVKEWPEGSRLWRVINSGNAETQHLHISFLKLP